MRFRPWIVLAIAVAICFILAGRKLVERPEQRAAPVSAPTPVRRTSSSSPRLVETSAGAGDDVLARALEGKEPHRAAPVQRPPGNYELHTVDGFSIVHLGEGPPTTRPFGGHDEARTRTVRGRVIDRAGHPVPNAIVLVDLGFNIHHDDLMVAASDVTDADGAFAVAAPLGDVFALALVREDWSELARVGSGPVELRMLGHGALHGRFTYKAEPEKFAVHVARSGAPLSGSFTSGADGTIAIPSLPPGTFEVSVGLAQAAGGTVSRSLDKEVTIVDGQTADLELAFASGTHVLVTARVPSGARPKGLTYWLFSGAAPGGGTDATARKQAEHTPSVTLGGGGMNVPAEFDDIAPGKYQACVGLFDVATMGAFDRPFGCRELVIEDGTAAREIEVALTN